MRLERVRHAYRAFQRRLASPPWYRDLCDYYGVTPDRALELGTRAAGRRPDLPGSSTTSPVSNLTFEEIWEKSPRDRPAAVHAFYREIGAWAAFRQVVYHRHSRFDFLRGAISPGSRICEYGAGVAPVSRWVVENYRRVPLEIVITDVRSEHLDFGLWRLRRRIEELASPIRVERREIFPDGLPLEGSFDAITILEVFEHLTNPTEVAAHLCDHLPPGGFLFENYVEHEHPHAADLAVAQSERPHVFALLRRRCEQVRGADPEEDGSATRVWQRR